ncbi:hypothetical protein [Halalkalicoccus subterraneus]|uniref:hypothetical protein n=1 Tax=Halalkalicoccus subterraneus TaxID=2675002 RepID=UPI001FE59252|nr:hypothetical protein [Halalkalicoccus subterraneus]
MKGLAFQAGITALLLATVGLLALLALFPTLPLSTCTEVAYTIWDAPGQPTFYGFDGSYLVYTPDGGTNECTTAAAVPGVPVVLLVLGGLLVAGSVLRK